MKRETRGRSLRICDLRRRVGSTVVIAFVMISSQAASGQTPLSTEPATPSESTAKPSAEELAKLKQNPVSGLRQVIFNAEVSPNVPGSGDTAGAYSLQVVWPFVLDKDWKLITYSILPVLQLPGTPTQESTVGLGDTLLNFFISPAKPGDLVWGVGPAVLLPTRSDAALGSDRVGFGPAAVLFYAKDEWSAGVVLQNVWSLGGTGINQVNAFSAQYIFNYNLPHGWYLYSNATITSNWNADAGDRWTVPLGGGVGRVFEIGKQSVGAAFQAFSNVVRPSDGPRWSWNLQLSLLFP